MLTYEHLWKEVRGTIPNLDMFLAQRFVNRAYRDIREARAWSFLVEESSLDIPDEITTGTMSVTQHSRIAVASAGLKTVLDALGLNIPLTSRQFRVGGGPLYQISAYDPAGTETWNAGSTPGAVLLERAYRETTSPTATYSIFKCIFSPPSTDFLSWISIRDIQDGRTILGESRPLLTTEELDAKDPQRSSTGDPYYIAHHKADSSLDPKFELWPHPASAKSLVARYRRRGVDFSSNSETLPRAIPDELLIDRALMYGSEWANKNKGRFAELKGVDWLTDAREHERRYLERLQRIKMQDEETAISNISMAPGYRPAHPVDSNWMQRHE